LIEIEVRGNDIEKGIRELKKRVNAGGIFREIKLRSEPKPSLRKKNKNILAIVRRRQKEKRRRQDMSI